MDGQQTDHLVTYLAPYSGIMYTYQRKENELTTPLYLMRAALCLEIEENYSKAIELYEMVYKNYPSSKDAVRAEKYAESLKLGNPVYKFDMSNGE